MRSIKRLFNRLKRAINYFIFGWDSVDYDYSSIEKYLLFKLKRIKYSIENGYSDLTDEGGSKTIKSINLCIRILERLENYVDRNSRNCEKKWGKREHVFIDGKLVTLFDGKVNEIAHRELVDAIHKDFANEDRYRRLLYKIMGKYITFWWD